MANIQVRVDDALRNDAVMVLNQIGMDMTTAVRILLKQIVASNGFPFKPVADPFYSKGNMEYLKLALDDVRHKRNLETHTLTEVP